MGVRAVDVSDGKKLLSITFEHGQEVISFIEQAIKQIKQHAGKILRVSFYNSKFNVVTAEHQAKWVEFFKTAAACEVKNFSFKGSRLHLANQQLLELIAAASKDFYEIELSHNDFGVGTAEQRLSQLQFFKALAQQVTSLDLSTVDLSNFGYDKVQELFTTLATSHTLKTVNLSSCDLASAGDRFDMDSTEEEQKKISRQLKELLASLFTGNLERISLANNALHLLDPEDFRDWFILIKELASNKLKLLDLSNTCLHTLIDLWLIGRENDDSSEIWDGFATLLQMPLLDEIRLYNNELTTEEQEQLISLNKRSELILKINREKKQPTQERPISKNSQELLINFNNSCLKTINPNVPIAGLQEKESSSEEHNNYKKIKLQ